MSKARVVISVIMSVILIAYMAIVPRLLEEQLGRDPYHEWLQPQESEYTGIITVWHIVEFKPYLGSITSWLKQRAKRIENAYFGIYIDVHGMTVDECAERIKNGESADIYSFPAGWCGQDMLADLAKFVDVPQMLGNLADSGVYNNKTLALPYLYSGYALMINVDILNRLNEKIPFDGIDTKWVQDGATRFDHYTGKKKKTHVYGMSGSRRIAAMLGIEAEVGEAVSFSEGKAAMQLCDLRAVGDMERKNAAGKGVNMTYYPISGYTDLVQYIGIASNIPAGKLLYAVEYIEWLLNARSQDSLLTLGAFPVITLNDAIIFEMDAAQSIYDVNTAPMVMNTFLYNAAKERIAAQADEVLMGTEGAYKGYMALIESLRK